MSKDAAAIPAAEPGRPGYPIESVDRALTLLLHFETADTISLAQASENLGVSRSTAYRLLTMLQYRGFVRQDPRTKTYNAGPALLRVGLAAVRELDVRAAAHSLLGKVVERVDETAHIVTLQGTNAFYLDCVEGSKQIRAVPLIGTSMPATATASGKALLAALPKYRLDAMFAKTKFPALTANTVSTLPALHRQLDQIREQGYAVNDEESEIGLRAIAVRVEHPNIKLSLDAAVAVAGPKIRLTDEWILDCVAEIQKLMDVELA